MAIRETLVSSGPIRGIPCESPDVSVFKGIPFAAPPTGVSRWKPPMPPAAWTDMRDCGTFSPVCPQTDFDPESFYYREFYYELAAEPMSEDCLYLNVWTPAVAKSEKLPVLFWIHGGGFVHGAGSEIEFDGEAISKSGAILVTFNYRVGVFGFLAHPELTRESPEGSSGNYGIQDQIAALKWTRQNIAAFGGDPDNITIFGQSAGAMSVQLLLASPLVAGDIARAVAQSGGGLGTFGRAQGIRDAEMNGVQWLEASGWDSIRLAREKTAEELHASLERVRTPDGAHKFGFRPVVDGYVTIDDPARTLLYGNIPAIPLMIGSLSDEGTSLGGKHGITVSMAASSRALAGIWTDRTGCPAYHYHFSRKAPGDGQAQYGAFHSAELWYLFGTQGRAWRPWESIDNTLSRYLVGYWTNFAKNGDPNGAGLPAWPAFTRESPLTQRISEQTAPFRLDADPEVKAAEAAVLAVIDGWVP
ncbi:MAG TPA: carboxylesterase family protein [Clostridia bacterium]